MSPGQETCFPFLVNPASFAGHQTSMSTLDLCLLLVTFGGFLSGGWAIYWARGHAYPGRALWGQWLFTCTIAISGLMALVAAFAKAQGLAPLSVLTTLLVVGMLWEY